MSEQPTDSSTDSAESLEQKAKERMDEMPAESALGNRDPQGGGEGDPKDFEPEGN
jgi:hypothetical protein